MENKYKCVMNTADREVVETFQKRGFDIIPVIESDRVSRPINRHSDVLYKMISGDCIYVSSCQKANKQLLEDCGYQVKLFDGLEPGYTTECRLNYISNDKHIIYNPKTAMQIDDLITEAKKLVKVKQGYTRCSVIDLGGKAYITSDEGIYAALKKEQIDCYLFNNREIRLEGYDRGFIGGSSCVLDNHHILIFGDISQRSEKLELQEFVYRYGYELEFIENKTITDIGSALII